MSLGDYFQQYIFNPLGLDNTTFEPLDDPKYCHRLTATHWRQKDGTLKQADENAGAKYARLGHHNGGGGLWSTADDLCRLLHHVFLSDSEPRLLSPESITEIFTPCLDTSRHMEERVARMIEEQELDILPQIPVDAPKNFGLGVAINLEELDTGLGARSAQWSGFPNCYWVCSLFILVPAAAYESIPVGRPRKRRRRSNGCFGAYVCRSTMCASIENLPETVLRAAGRADLECNQYLPHIGWLYILMATLASISSGWMLRKLVCINLVQFCMNPISHFST
jgi:hypothetical protein